MTPTRPVTISSSEAGSGVGERLGPLFGTLPPGPLPSELVMAPGFVGGTVAPLPAMLGIGVVWLAKIGGATAIPLDGA